MGGGGSNMWICGFIQNTIYHISVGVGRGGEGGVIWGFIQNTILMSFDIKFIRQDQKQCVNGEACRASWTCFWSSLIILIANDTYMVFYLSDINCRLNVK